MTTHTDRAALARIRTATERAVKQAAEDALRTANETIPFEIGTLAESGLVTVDGARASISYDTPYAARQHEDTRLRHNKGRRAKWLELSMAEQEQRLGQFLADQIGKAG